MSDEGTPRRALESDDEEQPDASRQKRARRGDSPFSALLPGGYMNDGGGSNGNEDNENQDAADEAPHQPGAIRRVKLKNFVTYSSVEFHPGPSLNMVIGPNGTGKSTLVCAICIGLGYDPKYLGRAKEVSEFVKHGAAEAVIEIELQRPGGGDGDGKGGGKGGVHPIVRCNIRRDGNKAMYTINRKPFSAKQVKQRMARLGVQIDNLCQFLPQDRVVEFAGMTPIELLRSTQRAVASQRMLDWHEQLKTLRRMQRELQKKKSGQDDDLASLEAQHRRQEADVQRIREHEEVRDRVRRLKAIRPMVEYEEKKKLVTEAKEQARTLGAELKDLEKQLEPALRQVNEKQEYRSAIKDARDDRKKELRRLFADLQQRDAAVKDLDSKFDNNKQIQIKLEEDVRQTRTRANQTRKKIRDLEVRIAQPETVTQEIIDSVYAKLRDLMREDRENDAQYENLKDERNGIEQQIREREVQIRQNEARLRDLSSRAGQQQEKLRKVNQDTARAWQWIQNNQDMFQQKIFGPPILECTVKDPRDVDMLEAVIPTSEMITISTQTKDDFVLLTRKLREQGLTRVNQRHVAASLDRYRPPAGAEELRRYGLEDWVLNKISGPEVCIASLCEGAKIHLTGYGSRNLNETQYEAISRSSLQQWVTPDGSYRVTRRKEYGPGAVSTTTKAIKKARLWSNEPVDVQLSVGIKQAIAELSDEAKELEIQIKELDSSRRRALAATRSEIKAKIEDVRREQTRCQKERRERDALPIRLGEEQARLQQSLDEEKNAMDEALRLGAESDGILQRKAEAALEHADGVEAARTWLQELHEAEIMLIEATSDCQTLKERNEQAAVQLDAKRAAQKEALAAHSRLRAEVTEFAKRLKRDMDRLDDEVRHFFREVRERLQTCAALDAETESQQARLSLLQGDDGGRTLAVYEERAERIARLRVETADAAAALAEVSDRVARIRREWEPRLERLVARISRSFEYNMRQINCAGEVGVVKDEDDYDRWAIAIRVKFREDEPLAALDSHRQSGGERAVSTIFYLMSLQSLTRSPFRVVDEINQGMDPRNERLVHARMVSIATGRDDMPVQRTAIPVHRREDDDDDDDDEDEGGDDDGNDNNEDNDGGDDRVGRASDRAMAGGEEEEAEGAEGAEEAEDAEVDGDGDGDEDMPDTANSPAAGSQYFLITPKLLPDLRYEPGMRVLCIGSGEHMPPPDAGIVDFGRALQLRTGALAAAAAAAG